MSSVVDELREIQENIATLIAAKDEKDANGETERYRELKRNAWGNVRRAEKVLPGLIERVAELENTSPPSVYETYRRVVEYLQSIPAYHIPRSHLSHHADPMRRGKDETAIEVAFHLNDTSDASLPPQSRFDAVTMKFMLIDGRFVRTTPKELPEMSEEAREAVRGIEAIVCGQGIAECPKEMPLDRLASILWHEDPDDGNYNEFARRLVKYATIFEREPR